MCRGRPARLCWEAEHYCCRGCSASGRQHQPRAAAQRHPRQLYQAPASLCKFCSVFPQVPSTFAAGVNTEIAKHGMEWHSITPREAGMHVRKASLVVPCTLGAQRLIAAVF